MRTATEILMLRADSMRRLDHFTRAYERDMLSPMVDRLFGMQVHVVPEHMKDILTTKHYSVEKLPGKKRRKGYRVKCERQPCAFVVNRAALDLSPFNMRIDF